jgi:hypothetical protein
MDEGRQVFVLQSSQAPTPRPLQGEGHLAVGVLADGAFAASTVPVIVYLTGRCVAVCKTERTG